ncbi:hypothetical protein [Mahella australiensis]|uniref:Uncharacterized protein n=1 Tax=Mahella australiensis (strain DSM 15567 / CIP 107919 / 50-1 BON) TaxID=697281 RepID=F3ZWW3_MAHA5|nr:hypothetical protein [Mahella australiensis]AEE97585.1 hypothetical protein Mahau_2423 [Mahella australiensis 50-1 BON]
MAANRQLRKTGRPLCRLKSDKRGDAVMIFISVLILIFGILMINFTGVTQLSISRQKIYNAVQDGLTIARGKSIAVDNKNVTFNANDARNRVLTSLANNNISVENLQVWYSNKRIYASGIATLGHLGVDTSKTERISFKYSLDVYKNFK